MTSPSWIEKIKERLQAATPGKVLGQNEYGILQTERDVKIESFAKFHRHCIEDVSHLLEALEKKDELINKIYLCCNVMPPMSIRKTIDTYRALDPTAEKGDK